MRLFRLPVSDEVTRPVLLCFLHNQWRKLNSLLILAFELLFREAHLFPLLMWWMRSRGETRTFWLNLTCVLALFAFSCSYPLHICLKRLKHSSNYEEDPVKRIRGFNEESASGFVVQLSQRHSTAVFFLLLALEDIVSKNEATFAHAITSSIELQCMTWYLRKRLRVMRERQDPSYFLEALLILTFFQEESNLWKHQLLSAIATQREQHLLLMLEDLWKSGELHVLVLKKVLYLYHHSDSIKLFNILQLPECGHCECQRWKLSGKVGVL